jgi:hypothetical protein
MKTNLGGNRFVGQLGNGQQDHTFWRRPDEIGAAFPVYLLTPSAPGGQGLARAGARRCRWLPKPPSGQVQPTAL